jgi:hypothetical protein
MGFAASACICGTILASIRSPSLSINSRTVPPRSFKAPFPSIPTLYSRSTVCVHPRHKTEYSAALRPQAATSRRSRSDYLFAHRKTNRRRTGPWSGSRRIDRPGKALAGDERKEVDTPSTAHDAIEALLYDGFERGNRFHAFTD